MTTNALHRTVAVRRTVARPVAHESESRSLTAWLAYLGAHVVAGPVIYTSELIATAHAYATLAVGIYLALFARRPIFAAYAAAYVVGSEVLWRMSDSDFFWEGGKYASAAILLVAMIRFRMSPRLLPVGYFLLLLPSIAQIVSFDEIWEVRGKISANLSGPFALLVCACYFANLKITKGQLQRLFLVPIGPALAIATITLMAISLRSNISWGNESNEIAAGGFGPNQVSSALALGAVFACFCIVKTRSDWRFNAVLLVAGVFLAAQSALTFSRGGLYNAAAAILCASIFWVRASGTRRKFLLTAALITAAAVTVVLPQLDTITGGSLSTRFSDTSTTKRVDLMLIDVEIFKSNPILGVGPGASKEEHAEYLDRRHSTHTEFSRLLAEHGLFGAGSLLLLLVMGLTNVVRARSANNKALAASMTAWSFAYMLNAAMRLAAPSFAFGLAFATLVDDEPRNERPSARRSGPVRTRAITPARAGVAKRGARPARRPARGVLNGR